VEVVTGSISILRRRDVPGLARAVAFDAVGLGSAQFTLSQLGRSLPAESAVSGNPRSYEGGGDLEEHGHDPHTVVITIYGRCYYIWEGTGDLEEEGHDLLTLDDIVSIEGVREESRQLPGIK